MKIAVIGTGMVGRALASRTAELGHDVAIGTRDPDGALRLYERAGVAPVVGSVLHENEIGRPRSGIQTARARAGFGDVARGGPEPPTEAISHNLRPPGSGPGAERPRSPRTTH